MEDMQQTTFPNLFPNTEIFNVQMKVVSQGLIEYRSMVILAMAWYRTDTQSILETVLFKYFDVYK